jgi:nucleoside-diphosphate-sugar epimerase
VNLDGARVAVTGATGFLGRYIVDALLRRGARVVGVVRNPGRVPELVRRGVELRKADLGEPERLANGFSDVAAVVSNAALFSLRNASWSDHERANLVGTENVFAAAARRGVRRIVHVSSVAVYAGASRDPVREDHPQYSEHSRRWPWTVYRISKALSEQLAWRLAARHGLELSTVRPCGIYGAFDPNFTRVFRWLVGPWVGIAPHRLRLPLVYAGDVAEAIARCLERPVSIGKAYNVTGDDEDLGSFIAAWRAAGGAVGWPCVPLPLSIRLNPRFDNGRAKAELGWGNRPYLEALRETLMLEAPSGARMDGEDGAR